MPELHEMENYRDLLSKQIGHKTITNVIINREKSINVPVDQFQKDVLGQTILSIDRRGKHLLFHLQNGYVLLLHLMLGGTMYVGTEEDQPERTKQVIFYFPEKELFFIGLRLGYLHVFTKAEVEVELQNLGTEPIEDTFTFDVFKGLIDFNSCLKAQQISAEFFFLEKEKRQTLRITLYKEQKRYDKAIGWTLREDQK